MQRGTFRRDLFYRLNVIPIRLPSLRERQEDIRPLALHFLSRFNHAGHASEASQASPRNVSLSPEALRRLEQHPWPGNIRELGNVIERLVLLADHTVVSASELERFLPLNSPLHSPMTSAVEVPLNDVPETPPLPPQALPLVRGYLGADSHSAAQLQQALAAHGGNQSRAAQAVGLTVRQFSYRLRKLETRPS